MAMKIKRRVCYEVLFKGRRLFEIPLRLLEFISLGDKAFKEQDRRYKVSMSHAITS